MLRVPMPYQIEMKGLQKTRFNKESHFGMLLGVASCRLECMQPWPSPASKQASNIVHHAAMILVAKKIQTWDKSVSFSSQVAMPLSMERL
jgi:hypothetical protein